MNEYELLAMASEPTSVVALIEEVALHGSEWTITKQGEPVAVILNYDDYRSLIEEAES